MFRLVHLSDVHLGPLPKATRRELASKRITGYVNWHRNRRDAMGDDTLEKLISHVHKARADHIVITGDLINLALDEEIDLMADWLGTVGAPKSVTVIPGNHDTYVPGALAKIRRAWAPYMSGDGAHESQFPFHRAMTDGDGNTPVSLIATNSGRATAPFMATGSFRQRQAKALSALLDDTARSNRFRIVLIHHPPFKGATHWNKRLIGASRFRKVIRNHGAELVLHGHTHIESEEMINGPYQSVRVIGVPSASQQARPERVTHDGHDRHGKPGAQYNLFEITELNGSEPSTHGKWSVQFDQFGFADGADAVTHLRRTEFDIPDSKTIAQT
ncbi:MAG: metallophosphoesterase [Pseudomonadota bacterium]